jgi:hypothetical protein
MHPTPRAPWASRTAPGCSSRWRAARALPPAHQALRRDAARRRQHRHGLVAAVRSRARARRPRRQHQRRARLRRPWDPVSGSSDVRGCRAASSRSRGDRLHPTPLHAKRACYPPSPIDREAPTCPRRVSRTRLPHFSPSARSGSIGARSRSSSPTCRSSIRTTICGTAGLALPAGRAAGDTEQRPQHRRDRLCQAVRCTARRPEEMRPSARPSSSTASPP